MIPPNTCMENVWNALCMRGISCGVASYIFAHNKRLLCLSVSLSVGSSLFDAAHNRLNHFQVLTV